MKVLVTGATGFVGRHVVNELVKRGIKVTATSRDPEKARLIEWFGKVEYIPLDLGDRSSDMCNIFGHQDVVVHLAWSGLPNYRDLAHIEKSLPDSYNFLKNCVMNGTKQVLVAGTCLEYGMQCGPLSEETPAMPFTSYGLAKDSLRKFLEMVQREFCFVFQWIRFFYMYGQGQNSNSLISQLDAAIDEGKKEFPMSGGEQLRDYLSINEVANRICYCVENPRINGIINCCSGKPVSVRTLVEKRIMERGAEIKLNLGCFPYPDYEPMAFWGVTNKLIAYKGR